MNEDSSSIHSFGKGSHLGQVLVDSDSEEFGERTDPSQVIE